MTFRFDRALRVKIAPTSAIRVSPSRTGLLAGVAELAGGFEIR